MHCPHCGPEARLYSLETSMDTNARQGRSDVTSASLTTQGKEASRACFRNSFKVPKFGIGGKTYGCWHRRSVLLQTGPVDFLRPFYNSQEQSKLRHEHV